MEVRWNKTLERVAAIEWRVAEHDAALSPRATVASVCFDALAGDLRAVWETPTTDARLKKRIARAVIHEAIADLDEATAEIVLTLHWVGGAHDPAPAATAPARPAQQHARRRRGGGARPGADRRTRVSPASSTATA